MKACFGHFNNTCFQHVIRLHVALLLNQNELKDSYRSFIHFTKVNFDKSEQLLTTGTNRVLSLEADTMIYTQFKNDGWIKINLENPYQEEMPIVRKDKKWVKQIEESLQ